MKKTFYLPSWSRALLLTSCLGLGGTAVADAPERARDAHSELEHPQEPFPDGPVADTLLVPEAVVHAMELYEAFQGDTVTGSQRVQHYLESLPADQHAAYVNYFEAQAQQSLQAAEELYALEAQADPSGALSHYEETLRQTQGYDGAQPHSVPLFEDIEVHASRVSMQGREDREAERLPACEISIDHGSGTYQEYCPGGGPTPAPPPPPPPPPPPSGCSSYTDRFGRSWSRCDYSPVAYVYIHGAGNYGSYESAAHNYWGWSNLGGNTDGQDRFFVSWDATQSVQSQVGTVRTALDTLCAPQRPCVIITHSAGGMMMGNILAQENRWNILRVHATQSAAGGSELANLSLVSPILWIVNSLGLLQSIGGYPIYSLSLPVPIARTMYNHDVTRGVPFFTYASEKERPYRSCRWYQVGCHLDNAWSSLVNGTLRGFYGGGSDWLVAYHSSSAFRTPNLVQANTTCNPHSWTSPNGWGVPYTSSAGPQNFYWTNHTSYHWQPQGQGLGCRPGFPQVDHSGGQMARAMPRP